MLKMGLEAIMPEPGSLYVYVYSYNGRLIVSRIWPIESLHFH